MAIDASIYGNIGRGVKSVADYDNEYAQAGQNKLANLMNSAKLDEYKRGVADEAQVRELTRQSGGDMNKLSQALYGAGNYRQGAAIAKDQGAQEEQRGKVAKQRVELVDAKLKQQRSFLRPGMTAEDYLAWHESQHTDPVLGPELASRGVTAESSRASIMQALQKPGGLEDLIQKSALGMEKFIEMNKPTFQTRNTGGTTDTLQLPGMGGAPSVVSSIKNTQSPDSVASIANSANNAELTDARAREFNSTKVEENKLKREQKQETADLTKSSQIASFDTMLGTLDRLGKHPGLTRSVGAAGMFPTMPGSDSANFQAELNTFQSQAFLPMVAQLKGMGALSDAEGKKLTAAVGALDPKMGEEAFRESVARITADMQAARARMSGGAQSGATGSWGDTEPTGKPVSIKNAADYANVPAGATYISPDGKMRTKR